MPVPIILPISFVVLAILGLFAQKDILLTIGSGIADCQLPTNARWINPFKSRGILDFADSFVALQADYIVSTIIPGSTSSGRPYVSHLEPLRANLTAAVLTAADMIEPSVSTNVTDSDIWMGSYPMDSKPAHLEPVLLTDLVSSFWTVLLLSSIITLLAASVLSLLLMNRSLHATITDNAFVHAMMEKFDGVTATDHMRNMELLRELKLGLPYTTPSKEIRLEGLHTHIDFVLDIITERDANRTQLTNIRAERGSFEQALTRKTANCDSLQDQLREASAQLAELFTERDTNRTQLSKARAEREDLEQALSRNIPDCDSLREQLREASAQLAGLLTERDAIRAQLIKACAEHKDLEKALSRNAADCDSLREQLRKASAELAELSEIRESSKDLSKLPLPQATDDELLDPQELLDTVKILRAEVLNMKAPTKDELPVYKDASTDISLGPPSGTFSRSSVSPSTSSSHQSIEPSPALNASASSFTPSSFNSVAVSQRSSDSHSPLVLPTPLTSKGAAVSQRTTGSISPSSTHVALPGNWRPPELDRQIHKDLVKAQLHRLHGVSGSAFHGPPIAGPPPTAFYNSPLPTDQSSSITWPLNSGQDRGVPTTPAQHVSPSTLARQDTSSEEHQDEEFIEDPQALWPNNIFNLYQNSTINAAHHSPPSAAPTSQEVIPASSSLEVKPGGDTPLDAAAKDEGHQSTSPPITTGTTENNDTTKINGAPSENTPSTLPQDNGEATQPPATAPDAPFVQPSPPSSRRGGHQDQYGPPRSSHNNVEAAQPPATAPDAPFVQPAPPSSRRGGYQNQYGQPRGRGNFDSRGRGRGISNAAPSRSNNAPPATRNSNGSSSNDTSDPGYYYENGIRRRRLPAFLQEWGQEREEESRSSDRPTTSQTDNSSSVGTSDPGYYYENGKRYKKLPAYLQEFAKEKEEQRSRERGL
ncbi:MAG: hypothetical protein Q9220_001945 [cf. Caloplaca sp. 1 TL-2023]